TTCDHAGPLTRTVADARLMYDALVGRRSDARGPSGPRTFGVPGGYLLARLDTEVRAAFERVRSRLAAAGHRVIDTDIPSAAMTPDVYLHIVLPEAARYHAPMLAEHADRYSPGV